MVAFSGGPRRAQYQEGLCTMDTADTACTFSAYCRFRALQLDTRVSFVLVVMTRLMCIFCIVSFWLILCLGCMLRDGKSID